MNKNKMSILNRTVSILCIVAMLTTVIPVSAFLKEVNANETTQKGGPVYLEGFRHVSISDFVGDAAGEPMVAKEYGVGEHIFHMQDSEGNPVDSLDKHLISMKVKFTLPSGEEAPHENHIAIAGTEESTGFSIYSSTDGKTLYFSDMYYAWGVGMADPGYSYKLEFSASEAGVDAFTKDFLLQISVEYLSNNQVQFGFYFNGTLYNDEKYIVSNCTMDNFGSYLNLIVERKGGQDIGRAITVSEVVVPVRLQGFQDVGISNFVDVTAGEQMVAKEYGVGVHMFYMQDSEGNQAHSFDKKLISMKVKFTLPIGEDAPHENRIAIAGTATSTGFGIYSSADGETLYFDDMYYPWGLGMADPGYGYKLQFAAAEAGVDAFTEEFLLQISVEYLTDNQVQFGFYFNGNLYNDEKYSVSNCNMESFGTCLNLIVETKGGQDIGRAITIADIDGLVLEKELQEVTIGNFANADTGEEMVAKEYGVGNHIFSLQDSEGNPVDSLDQKLISMKVKFTLPEGETAPHENRIAIAGTAESTGFAIYSSVDGSVLYFADIYQPWGLGMTENGYQLEFSASEAGVDTFTEEFLLQISVEYLTDDQVQFGFYFDGELYNEEKYVVSNCKMETFGSYLNLIVETKSGQDIGRAITVGEVTDNVTGEFYYLSNDLNPYTGVLYSTGLSIEYTLDRTYNSVGYGFAEKQKVNYVILADNEGTHRLHRIDLSLYVSDDNITYTRVPNFDMARSGKEIYLYNFDEEAKYVKVHCHYDTAEASGFTNRLANMITAGYSTELPGAGGGAFQKIEAITMNASSTGEDVFGYIPYSDLDFAIDVCENDKRDLRFVLDGNMLPYMLDEQGAYVRIPSAIKGTNITVDIYGNNPKAVSLSDNEIFEVTYGNKTVIDIYSDNVFVTEIAVTRAPNGDLLAMSRGYTSDVMTKMYQRRSTDGGRTWGQPELIIDAYAGENHEKAIYGGGFLVDNGTIWYTCAYGRDALVNDATDLFDFTVFRSDDNGVTWTGPQVYETNHLYIQAYCDPVKTTVCDGDGPNIDYVAPYCYVDSVPGEFSVSVMLSRDGGESWVPSGAEISYELNDYDGHEAGVSETGLAVLSDGTLKMVMRCQFPGEVRLAEATSKDHGATWTNATPSNLISPNTMPSMTNHEEDIYLLWAGNNSMGGTSYQRYPLNLAYSDDDTVTWQKKMDLYAGTRLAGFTYNGSTTLNPEGSGATQPTMTFSSYQGSSDLMLTWTHNWYRNTGMLIEDIEDFMHKTKGVSDDFEGSSAKYENWFNATTKHEGEWFTGTSMGTVELTTEKAANGSKQSLKMKDHNNADGVPLRATRSVPAMMTGEISFDVNIAEMKDGFNLELKSSFNKSHYDYDLLMVSVDKDGKIYGIDIETKTAGKVLGEIPLNTWNHFTVKFDLNKGTAQLYLGDELLGNVPVNTQNTEGVCFVQFSDGSGSPNGLTCYIDNFMAYEGVTVIVNDATVTVAPEITDSLALNYTATIKKSLLQTDVEPYMTFVMNGRTLVKVIGKPVSSRSNVYTFKYSDVKAQNMAETITATLVVGDYTKEYQHSVWDYCKTVLDTTDGKDLVGLAPGVGLAELKHLVVDLVQYGAEVQEYRMANGIETNVSDDLLLSNKLTETYKAFDVDQTTESLSDIVSQKGLSESQTNFDYKWTSATLVLKDKINLRFRFTIAEGYTKQVVIKVIIRGNTYTFQSDDIKKDSKSANGYYVDFDNIMANEYGEAVQVTICSAEDVAVSATLTYSVDSYLCEMTGNNVALDELLVAIHSFGTAAMLYQEQISKDGVLVTPGLVGDGITDNTEKLQELLETEKHIQFGVGKYLLSNITIPEDVTIQGMGNGTELIFDPSATGAMLSTTSSNVTIRDMRLVGGNEITSINSKGNRTGVSVTWSADGVYDVKLYNLQVLNFSNSGIYAMAVGATNGMVIDSCTVKYCHMGIHLDFRSEFVKMTNTYCGKNYIGAQVDSGNNIITASQFAENTYCGFIIRGGVENDNHAHNPIANCQFVHNETMEFMADQITYGLLLNNCVFADKEVKIKDSRNVMLQNSLFSGSKIIVSSGGWNVLRDSLFLDDCSVNITDNTLFEFENVRNSDGSLYTYGN